jgi:hypothetical protein
MSRKSETRVEEKARRVFRRRKVLTLEEVAGLIGGSIHTARRRLKAWGVHTSYNQNGRYYVLPEVPEFDRDGLWRWRKVFFSRHGNLKQTVVELIGRSEAGLDAGEIGSLLGLDPRSFLSAFADHPGIQREKRHGRFVYYSAESSVRSAQQQRRGARSAPGRPPTPHEAIAILLEKIKHPDLGSEALARRLRKQKLCLEPEAIERFFVQHGLALKKTPRSI